MTAIASATGSNAMAKRSGGRAHGGRAMVRGTSIHKAALARRSGSQPSAISPSGKKHPQVSYGSEADIAPCPLHVRFTPKANMRQGAMPSEHQAVRLRCPLSANSRHRGGYSITSSAATSRPDGTVRPRALAVLRLTAVSNFVGACTGKSAGRKRTSVGGAAMSAKCHETTSGLPFSFRKHVAGMKVAVGP